MRPAEDSCNVYNSEIFLVIVFAAIKKIMNKNIVQIGKNILTSWGMIVVQAAVGLIIVPFLFGHLGKEGYGVIGIVGAIIGMAEIADLGLRQALNRELSEKVAREDAEGFRKLSSSALFLYVIISLLIGALGACFAPSLCSLFRIGPEFRTVTILLLRTYAPFTILLSFITPVFTAGLCSFMRYDIQNKVSMGAHLCSSLMLFVCLSMIDANPFVSWCAVMAGGAILRLGVMYAYYRKICFKGFIGIRYFHFDSLLPLFKLGGVMYVLQLTNMLAQRMDPLIISRFIGLGGVALYEAGSKLPNVINPIVMAGVNQMVPLTTRFHVTENQKREQQTLVLGTKYTLYLGAFFSAGMLLFADSFCHLWLFDKLGEDVRMVALVLKVWAIIKLFNCAGGPQWPIVLGKKRLAFSVWLAVITSVFNVILSVYLVGFTNIGVVGVLIGTMITEIVRRPIAAWYVSWILNMKLRDYFLNGYLAPFGFFVLLLSTGWLLLAKRSFDGWGELVFSGVVLGAWAVIMLLLFEWKLISSLLKKYRFC